MRLFLFTVASRPAIGFIQSPIQWVTRVLIPGTKQPGRVADRSPPLAEAKNVWSYASSPPICLHVTVA